MKNAKRILALVAALALVAVLLAACGGGSSSTPTAGGSSGTVAAGEDKPATWIADRHIKGRLFADDFGSSLPKDQINNAVAQKIKEMTGITLEWEYTTGNTDLEVLITALAAGDIPDVIFGYLDDSSRPEWPVLYKAANEGMFADIKPYLADCQIYSKYLNEDYLSYDSFHNVTHREDFNGAVYFLQTQVPREPGTTESSRIMLYMNTTYGDEVGIKPDDITSSADLMEAARTIKAAGLKDANGQDVVPVGPTCWSGRLETWLYKSFTLSNGRDTLFYEDNGEVMHISKSPLLLQQVEYVQTMLKEGLFDPEIFTMEGGRAQENFLGEHYAFQVMSNWQAVDKTLKTGANWVPVTNMENARGDASLYEKKKDNWGFWAVSAKAENPEEIVKFADFLASKEGKLIWMYGIEGEHYDLDDNGQPVTRAELVDLLNNDFQAAMDYNIMALEGYWGRALGNTDLAQYEDFGEWSFLEKLEPERAERARELRAYGNPKITYYDGSPAAGFLGQMPQELQLNLQQFIEPVYHKDIFIQACFASSMAEAEKMLTEYRTLMESQGIVEFEEYLQKVYDETPEAIHFQ